MKKLFVALMAVAVSVARAELLLTSEDKVAFYGDAIVYYAHNSGHLFIRNLMAEMKKAGVDFGEKNMVFAGRFDQTAAKLLESLEEMVLSKKPTWLFYMGCYYDASYGKENAAKPKDIEEYRRTLAETFQKVKAAGVKCAVMSLMMQGEDVESDINKATDKVNAVLKEEAEKAGFAFIDMNAAQKKLKREQGPEGLPVTAWGSLTSPITDWAMTECVLRFCGIPEENIRARMESFRNKRGSYSETLTFSINEWERISKAAAAEGLKPSDYVQKLCTELVGGL